MVTLFFLRPTCSSTIRIVWSSTGNRQISLDTTLNREVYNSCLLWGNSQFKGGNVCRQLIIET